MFSRVASLRWKPVHTRWHLRLGFQQRAYEEFLCRYEGIWKARAGHPPHRIGLWVYRSGAVFYLSFVFPFPISFCFWRLPFSFQFPQIFSSPSKRESQQCNTFLNHGLARLPGQPLLFLFSLLFLFFCIISFVILSGRFLSFVPFLSTELWVHGIFWGSHGIKRGLLRA